MADKKVILINHGDGAYILPKTTIDQVFDDTVHQVRNNTLQDRLDDKNTLINTVDNFENSTYGQQENIVLKEIDFNGKQTRVDIVAKNLRDIRRGYVMRGSDTDEDPSVKNNLLLSSAEVVQLNVENDKLKIMQNKTDESGGEIETVKIKVSDLKYGEIIFLIESELPGVPPTPVPDRWYAGEGKFKAFEVDTLELVKYYFDVQHPVGCIYCRTTPPPGGDMSSLSNGYWRVICADSQNKSYQYERIEITEEESNNGE